MTWKQSKMKALTAVVSISFLTIFPLCTARLGDRPDALQWDSWWYPGKPRLRLTQSDCVMTFDMGCEMLPKPDVSAAQSDDGSVILKASSSKSSRSDSHSKYGKLKFFKTANCSFKHEFMLPPMCRWVEDAQPLVIRSYAILRLPRTATVPQVPSLFGRFGRQSPILSRDDDTNEQEEPKDEDKGYIVNAMNRQDKLRQPSRDDTAKEIGGGSSEVDESGREDEDANARRLARLERMRNFHRFINKRIATTKEEGDSENEDGDETSRQDRTDLYTRRLAEMRQQKHMRRQQKHMRRFINRRRLERLRMNRALLERLGRMKRISDEQQTNKKEDEPDEDCQEGCDGKEEADDPDEKVEEEDDD